MCETVEVTGFAPPEQHHVQEDCPMSSTTYHTGNTLVIDGICFAFILNLNTFNYLLFNIGLAPETVDFKLSRLNWMPFLRLT